MKSRFMKVLSLVLVMSFLLVLSACGSSGNNQGTTAAVSSQAAQTQETAVKTPVKLTMFFDVVDDPNNEYSKFWGTNPVTKKIIEDTGVDLQISYAPDTTEQKINLMIASDDLPDLLESVPTPIISKLVQNDKVWALDELAAQYKSDFMNIVPRNVLLAQRLDLNTEHYYEARFGWIKPENMDKSWARKNYQGITVIKDIYEALGSPAINTADDYINMLKQVKQKYPEFTPVLSSRRDGTDSYGTPRILQYSLPLAGLAYQPFFKDGDVYKRFFESPAFLKAIKFVNTLYNEGLIDKAEFTNKTEVNRSNIANAKIFSELNEDFDNLVYWSDQMAAVRPNTQYIMINPPKLDANVEVAYASANYTSGAPNAATLVITKKCKDPEAALRFLNYMYSDETQRMIVYGIEGVHHDMVNGEPVLRQEFADAYKADALKLRSETGIYYVNMMTSEWKGRFYDQVYGLPDFVKEAAIIANKNVIDYNFMSGAEAYDENSDENKAASIIKDYYTGEIMKIIVAKPGDVDKLYTNMIEKIKGLGLDKINAYATKYLAEYQAKVDKYSK